MKKLTKRAIPVISLSLIILLFTGCIDVLQFVSLHDGTLELSVRYTIQKALLEMAGTMGGGVPDYSSIFEIGDGMFKDFQGITGESMPIDTALEAGMELKVRGEVDRITDEMGENASFIPVRRGEMYQIRIPAMNDEVDAEEWFGAAFLSAAKYRILVDLTGDLSNITGARISAAGEFLDQSGYMAAVYGSSLLIEISMAFVAMSTEDLVVELY